MIDSTLIKPQQIPLPNDPNIPNPLPLTFGTLYTFQLANVELLPHKHTDSNSHFTIVMSGSFNFIDNGITRVVKSGDIVDVGLAEHSFESLEPNSVILNITKYGTTAESIAKDILDVKQDIEKISETILNMKALLG